MQNSLPTNLPTNAEETAELLKAYGALVEGHFQLASGRHSGHYVKKGQLIQYPAQLQEMINQRVDAMRELGQIDVVLSPAVGGIPVGQQVGLALNARTIYAERGADNELELKRGFSIEPGERVLMVEDVITTGGTLEELEQFVGKFGGEVAGVFVVVNRSGRDEILGHPMVSCMDIVFPTYAPDEVPAELAAIPAVRPGTKKVD
ncbi:orotate phosphoribosyltransferase [Sulfuriroseicoccus oceanibius]|uniref:Orotate phosphoribosyltransferase n=1 Tax=Sulfuriroseicoccus oceanibius TaxID=2707525 RepID=A0A6B3L2M9_9BACT|nr:orotate phosphoribosyltransferase [Sulfuriroseicoccus oceanibius]QQL44353.1 orotate phosphoribosyltransferase [Sulfuriroseicoccus oceanibius]